MPLPSLSPSPSRRAFSMMWKILPLFALLVLGGMAWSIKSIYQEREKRFRHQVEWELQAISQLQAKSVAEWRERRLSDAMALSDDTLFAQAVARWFQAPAEPQASEVLNRLRILQERALHGGVSGGHPGSSAPVAGRRRPAGAPARAGNAGPAKRTRAGAGHRGGAPPRRCFRLSVLWPADAALRWCGARGRGLAGQRRAHHALSFAGILAHPQ